MHSIQILIERTISMPLLLQFGGWKFSLQQVHSHSFVCPSIFVAKILHHLLNLQTSLCKMISASMRKQLLNTFVFCFDGSSFNTLLQIFDSFKLNGKFMAEQLVGNFVEEMLFSLLLFHSFICCYVTKLTRFKQSQHFSVWARTANSSRMKKRKRAQSSVKVFPEQMLIPFYDCAPRFIVRYSVNTLSHRTWKKRAFGSVWCQIY